MRNRQKVEDKLEGVISDDDDNDVRDSREPFYRRSHSLLHYPDQSRGRLLILKPEYESENDNDSLPLEF